MNYKQLITTCFYLFSLFCVSYSQEEQLCQGSLGDNIFEDGDFGSGTANIVAQDPGIAPGYTYTRTTPPSDGFYSITNNTGEWSNLYGSWLEIRDNSDDPNGYMMVVNASFSPGIFYEKKITGLCEGTLYEFSADIINIIKVNEPGHSEPNVSFFLDNEEQFSTGRIPQDARWKTFGFTFTTPPGVTEMTLTLRNNAPGGIGNDLALDNISFRACGASAFINTEENIFLCEDDNDPAPLTADIDVDDLAIQWQTFSASTNSWMSIPDEIGEQFFHDIFDAGTYQYRYLSAGSRANLNNFKCRIISDVITIEVLPLFYELSDTICEGTAYQLGDTVLTEPGTYTATLLSSQGCDSIVTVDLAVLPNQLSFELDGQAPACVGDQDGSISLANIQNALGPLRIFMNGDRIQGTSISNLNTGLYSFSLEDAIGCTATNNIALTVDNPFRIDVGEDLNLDLGQTIDTLQVQATKNIVEITWAPSDFLSCDACPTPVLTAAQDISYVIRATDENGCTTMDSLNVRLNNEEINIYIPNAFSPNGDGQNDFFNVFSFDALIEEVRSMRIFDRWGGLVFESTNAQPNLEESGWNGRLNGEVVEEGVYIYQFELRLITGEEIVKSGTINLIR